MGPLLMDLQTVIAQWIVLGAVLCAVGYVLFRSKQKSDSLSGTSRPSLAQQRDAEHRMQSLVVEFAQVVREFHAELDSRADKLEALNRAADEKIAMLRKLSTRSEALPRVLIESPKTSMDPPDLRPDSRNEEVYLLADKGKTPREIAEELDRPSGEIELILALRSRS